MRSIESCWNYLRHAIGNQVIVSLGAGAYEILPLGPASLGESYLENSPARIVGVYAPGTELACIKEDADALEQHNPAR
jgi:hypothetical protein